MRNPKVNGVETASGATIQVLANSEVTIAPSACHYTAVPAGTPHGTGPNNKLATRRSDDGQHTVASFVPRKAGTYVVHFTDPGAGVTYASGFVTIVAS